MPPANPEIRPYGLWSSPMAPADLFSQPAPPQYPFRHAGRLHWLEALPEEGGRIALMRQIRGAAKRRCLTPAGFNIRTRVHEYGGRCFCVLGGEILFNNFSDGRLYRQSLDRATAPLAVTMPPPGGRRTCFADLVALPARGVVLAVMERATAGGATANALVAIDIAAHRRERTPQTPRVIADGSDFYAAPVCAADQTTLAWLEWDDPYMPWDQTRLVTADLATAPLRAERRRVRVEEAERAVCQPGFLADGSLLFASDGADCEFWDFFRLQGDAVQRVTRDDYEYGEAHWVFGERRWCEVGAGRIIAIAGTRADDHLVTLSIADGVATPLAADMESGDCAVYAHLHPAAEELLLVAHPATRAAEIRALPMSEGAGQGEGGGEGAAGPMHTVYRPAPNPPLDAADFRAPTPLRYPTRDHDHAHAYFYPPHNRHMRGAAGAAPPLMVVVHGGPTSRATAAFHPLKQYFASLGYAVLDINHRGSTGYGRRYRQRLLGRWGELDVADIADGIADVTARGWADPQRVFIRGGSAGGYAVLCALTDFPQLFRGGACYYGIGNLITLARITHPFERRYTDRLIGESFDPATAHLPTSRFTQRSPLFRMQHLTSPLILFQGRDDKVVPPAVSREVAAQLASKGIPHEYIEYPKEGHGFRRLATRVDSLTRETAFFAAILNAAPAAADH